MSKVNMKYFLKKNVVFTSFVLSWLANFVESGSEYPLFKILSTENFEVGGQCSLSEEVLSTCLTSTGKRLKTKSCTSATNEQLMYVDEVDQIRSVGNPEYCLHSSKKGKVSMKKCKVKPSNNLKFVLNAFRGTLESRVSLRVLTRTGSKINMKNVAKGFKGQQWCLQPVASPSQVPSTSPSTYEPGCKSICAKFDEFKIFDSDYRDKISNYSESPTPIGCWDTSDLTTLYDAFYNETEFNEDIKCWDTSKVTSMVYMFYDASSFNGDLSSWVTSKVTDMEGMFAGASSFNGDLSSWDTSKVTDMWWMFAGASSFNNNISSWDTSKVAAMHWMFYQASSFNGDLSSWDTSKVTDMEYMFYDASSFNGDLSSWDTSKVTDMYDMFDGASNFNIDISSWDTSKVAAMDVSKRGIRNMFGVCFCV